MTLGKFLSLRGIKSADPVAFRFRVWLGKKDEGRNYSERIWRATFNIFNRRDRDNFRDNLQLPHPDEIANP